MSKCLLLVALVAGYFNYLQNTTDQAMNKLEPIQSAYSAIGDGEVTPYLTK